MLALSRCHVFFENLNFADPQVVADHAFSAETVELQGYCHLWHPFIHGQVTYPMLAPQVLVVLSNCPNITFLYQFSGRTPPPSQRQRPNPARIHAAKLEELEELEVLK
jgi:hypothetical protein